MAILDAMDGKAAHKAVTKKPANNSDGAVVSNKPAASKAEASAIRKAAAPSLSVERSRKQVCCRTGQPGPKQNRCIPFGAGGEASAVRAGQAWLKAECKRQGARAAHFRSVMKKFSGIGRTIPEVVGVQPAPL